MPLGLWVRDFRDQGRFPPVPSTVVDLTATVSLLVLVLLLPLLLLLLFFPVLYKEGKAASPLLSSLSLGERV